MLCDTRVWGGVDAEDFAHSFAEPVSELSRGEYRENPDEGSQRNPEYDAQSPYHEVREGNRLDGTRVGDDEDSRSRINLLRDDDKTYLGADDARGCGHEG